MSLSPSDYALLAKDAYNNRSGDVGKQVAINGKAYSIAAYVDEPSGFQGTAYQLVNGNDVVIAYRGTEDQREPHRDGLTDASMVFLGVNPQASDARRFTGEVLEQIERAPGIDEPIHVSVTGHSLGGTLAEINAAEFKLPGHTFNAYGAAGLYRDLPPIEKPLINHVRAGDVIAAASPHVGQVRVYADQRDIDALEHAGFRSDGTHGFTSIVRMVDLSAHTIDNFTPKNPVLGDSILKPEAEALYRAHRAEIDHFRRDVSDIREHSSQIWMAHKAVAAQVRHGAEAFHEASRQAGAMAFDVLAAPQAVEALHASDPGMAELHRRLAAQSIDQPGHPGHPGHSMYQQALTAIEHLDAEHGRSPDRLSRHLAAALAVEGQRQGMTRIDHVMLSADASQAYAVQGPLDSPHKRVATLPTELGIAQSIEASSHAWEQIRQALDPQAAVAQHEQAMPAQAPSRTLH